MSSDYQVLDVQQSSIEKEPATVEKSSLSTETPLTPLSNVIFQTVSGQRFLIQVEKTRLPEMTIEQLKQCLAQIHSIPVNHQRLIFKGRELLDHESAATCQIESHSVILLALRLNVVPAEQQPQIQQAVSNADLQQVQQAQLRWHSRSVFFFALLDVIYGITSIGQSPLYIIVTLAGFVGWYGARYYSIRALRLYWLSTLFEIGLFIYQASQVQTAVWIIVYIVAAIVKVYVVDLICKFCILILSCSEEQRAALAVVV